MRARASCSTRRRSRSRLGKLWSSTMETWWSEAGGLIDGDLRGLQVFRHSLEIMFRVDRRHASRARGGDRLPVDVILRVAARKHARHARLRSVVRDDVAVRVHLDLPAEE